MTTASYSVNPNPPPLAANPDEAVALAGSSGFAAPSPIQGPNIIVGGVTLDYLGNSTAPSRRCGTFRRRRRRASRTAPAAPASAGCLAAVPRPNGRLSQRGCLRAGQRRGREPVSAHRGHGPRRWQRADGGTGPGAHRQCPLGRDGDARRHPHSDQCECPDQRQRRRSGRQHPRRSARMPDAPIFGIDVSLQKARSAVFFSRADAASAFHTINAITAPRRFRRRRPADSRPIWRR